MPNPTVAVVATAAVAHGTPILVMLETIGLLETGTTAVATSAVIAETATATVTMLSAVILANPLAAGFAAGATIGCYFAFDSGNKTKQQLNANKLARQAELAAATERNTILTQQLDQLTSEQTQAQPEVANLRVQRQVFATTRQSEQQRLQQAQQRREDLRLQVDTAEAQYNGVGPAI